MSGAGIDLLDLQHPAVLEMQAHLWASAESYVFEEGRKIVQPGEPISSMLVIQKGAVLYAVPCLGGA